MFTLEVIGAKTKLVCNTIPTVKGLHGIWGWDIVALIVCQSHAKLLRWTLVWEKINGIKRSQSEESSIKTLELRVGRKVSPCETGAAVTIGVEKAWPCGSEAVLMSLLLWYCHRVQRVSYRLAQFQTNFLKHEQGGLAPLNPGIQPVSIQPKVALFSVNPLGASQTISKLPEYNKTNEP